MSDLLKSSFKERILRVIRENGKLRFCELCNLLEVEDDPLRSIVEREIKAFLQEEGFQNRIGRNGGIVRYQ